MDKKKIPELRFPGFEGEWKEKKLGEVGIFIGGGTPDTKNSDFWEGNIPWASSSDITEKNINDIAYNRFITKAAVKKSAAKIIPKNSVLVVTRVGIGKIAVNRKELCTSQDFTNIVVDNCYVSRFIARLLLTKKREMMKSSRGTSIQGISTKDLKALKICIPTIKEQEKIEAFFNLIDKKIEKQEEKIKHLEKYKKGMMQKLFPAKGEKAPELRFEEFDEAWEERSLQKILWERKKFLEKNQGIPHGSLSKEGVTLKTERYDRDFLVRTDDKEYKITELGDICYNPANLKFDVICRNNLGRVIFSPIYITFETKKDFNNKYMGYYVTRTDFIKEVRQYEEGTVYERMAVKPKDFLKHKGFFPLQKEQDIIASFLSDLDQKIALETDKLTVLKELKKGLMQKMFV